MLICPQCNFENPNTNKFCQNCGTSLTHRVCPECSTDVALNTQYCDNCGTECGTVWWAILVKEIEGSGGIETRGQGEAALQEGFPTQATANPKGDTEIPGQEDVEDFPPSPHFPPIPRGVPESPLPLSYSPLPVGSYLDPQNRYQLLEPLPALGEADDRSVCVRVLDCQPYERSLLEVMLANDRTGVVTTSVGTSEIPSLAKPYIALQSSCNLGIPTIHDAWLQDDVQVVLIQDRSNWQHLVQIWHEETTSSLQIINFFYQMTQLWVVLERVNCRQSLLQLSNLRLDEDQSLALQQLYVEQSCLDIMTDMSSEDVQAQPLTIQALGRVWQALFRESQRTQFGSILHLLGDLELGKVESLVQLQSRLEAIASEINGHSSTKVSSATLESQAATASPTILQLDEEEEASSKGDDTPTVILPMQLIALDYAGLTDVGRQRDRNEDYFGVETEIHKLELPNNRTLQARGLYILCDGMGGHAGGEVASAMAVNTLRQYFLTNWDSHQIPTEDDICQAVRLANKAIYDLNQKDARSGVGRMGTTLVMVLLYDTQVAVAHVGDSRLYRLTRKSGLEQVTVDHEVGQREISRGVEPNVAYTRPDAYQLTQALGPRDEQFIIPAVKFLEINEDTLFILASDGLSDNNLLTTHWRTHLQPLLSSSADLDRGVKALIDMANNYNGHDNITAVVIRAKVRPNMEQQG